MNRTQLVHRKIQTVHCQISTVNVVPIRSDQAPGNVPTPHYSKPSADPLSVNAGPTEDPTQQCDLIRPQIPPPSPSSSLIPTPSKKEKRKRKGRIVWPWRSGGGADLRSAIERSEISHLRLPTSPPSSAENRHFSRLVWW